MRLGRPTPPFALLALLGCVHACTGTPTQLVVQVDTDIDPSLPLVFSARVWRTATPSMITTLAPRLRGATDGGISFPATFGVIPATDEAHDDAVTVYLQVSFSPLPGAPPVTISRTAAVHFVPNAVARVGVFLTRACALPYPSCTTPNVPCTASQHCLEIGETCGDDGSCVSIAVQTADAGTDATATDRAETNPPADVEDIPNVHDVVADVCTRQCSGRVCGPDGCGSTCGSCSAGHSCVSGQCVANASCGDGTCQSAETCENCPMDCACGGAQVCFQGSCCTPNCAGASCGGDGCGGSCGTCPAGSSCSGNQCVGDCGNGSCVSPENCSNCPSDCACPSGQMCNALGQCSITCGNGVCAGGETCASCPADCACGSGQSCYMGACCAPSCASGYCGSDGCGGTCNCSAGLSCVGGSCMVVCGDGMCAPGVEDCGVCAADCPCPTGDICYNRACCLPDCTGKSCGSDGCGGSCGTCAANEICDSTFTCTCPAANLTCGTSCCPTTSLACSCSNPNRCCMSMLPDCQC